MSAFSKQIDATINDVDNVNSGGSYSANSSSATTIGNPGAVTRNISLRFTSVTIPQGATINSAKITFVASSTKSPNVVTKIEGVAEDDTAQFVTSPEDTARTRSKTSASVAWSGVISETLDANLDTPSLTTIVQEIINRAGWVSGNDMGFYLSDNGSSSGEFISVNEYQSTTPNGSKAATLIIDYTSGSPSVSPSSSASPSTSPSASVSPSASTSPSPSSSVSKSPSPSAGFQMTQSVIEVSKSGRNVLTATDPRHLKFSSRWGTLKYYAKTNTILQVDGGAGNISGRAIITHNQAGYIYAEVFVRVYIGSPSGNYEYVPFKGSGATVEYQANVITKENTIELYGEFNGVSSSVWNFDFLVFLYKNKLNL